MITPNLTRIALVLALGLLGLSLWHCKELEQVPFPVVTTETANPDSDLNVQLNGTLIGAGTNGSAIIQEQGFIWGTDQKLDMGSGTPLLEDDNIGVNGAFNETIPNSELSINVDDYYYRAFVRFRSDALVYGDIQSFTLRSFVVSLNPEIDVENNQALISGAIGIVDASNFPAIIDDHGFVYSASNSTPSVGGTDVQTLSLGPTRDRVFANLLDSLNFNSTYYVRSYATVKDDLGGEESIYSAVEEFRVRDGWQYFGCFTNKTRNGCTGVINDIVYAGLGCKKLCGASARELYTLDLSDPEPLWEPVSPDFSEDFREGALSFVVADKLYFGFGNINTEIRNDLYRFDPVNGWSDMVTLLPGVDGTNENERSNAVAFTIGNKAYVGLGESQNVGLRRDFWEYDPSEDQPWGTWTQMDSFPLNPDGTSGRKDAAAAATGGFGYVGTGIISANRYKDFYRFDPSAGPGNMWTRIDDLPGDERSGASAFALNGDIFVGLGNLRNQDHYADFYRYDADGERSWKQVTSLPQTLCLLPEQDLAGDRWDAMSFTIFGNAYVGTGQRDIFNSDGLSVPGVLQDIWVYTPEE